MSAESANVNGTAPAAETEAAAPQEEGFRVYIGNLAYTSTEEDIRSFVTKAGDYEILSVVMPKKFGKRPAGFAFVLYKNEEDAKAVVEKLNGEELGDRKLSLEVARSKEEQAARREAIIEKRNAAKAEKAEQKAAASGAEQKAEGDEKTAEGEAKPKKKKARKPRRRVPEEGEDSSTAVEGGSSEVKSSKSSRSRVPREARIDEDSEPKERKPRERKPKLQLTNEQSESTVFVANLPFDVDDDALAAIFTNLSIRVKSAKVIRGLRSGRGGRRFYASRGFGFVEIEDAAQQKEAVEKVEGSLIGDRTISAKIAQEMKPIEVENATEGTE
ncbi:hypothetical protein BCR39DRAFT_558827 [Naematelia encephala]|uniref:RRM domain-containing protein n=1 Tax=Naematelia encephala TaxID=71784 RepID=A0A1Y2B5J3_9TREE|nr:hypothetical protein BCR39DRAFT_558827 [Naematelia encephala]